MNELPQLEGTGWVEVGSYRFQRLALGAMRLLSDSRSSEQGVVEAFAPPRDREASRQLLRAAVECGIGYIDFARGYGATPDAGESLFRELMWPYPEQLLWATKMGYQRDPQGGWQLNLDPGFIEAELERSLSVLGGTIPLAYLVVGSTSDVEVLQRPARLEAALGPLMAAQQRGQIGHLGVANVTLEELRELLEVAPIEVVQNKFTVADLKRPERRAVVELCRQRQIPFVAWGIFQSDGVEAWQPEDDLLSAAEELGVSPQDASIALLLKSSPNFVALTGASRSLSLGASVRAANLLVAPAILRRFAISPEA